MIGYCHGDADIRFQTDERSSQIRGVYQLIFDLSSSSTIRTWNSFELAYSFNNLVLVEALLSNIEEPMRRGLLLHSLLITIITFSNIRLQNI